MLQVVRKIPSNRPPASSRRLQATGRAARIRALKTELAGLENEQCLELVSIIAATVGARVCFHAADLLEHATVSTDLAAAFEENGITSALTLGRWLRQCPGVSRVCRDELGIVWCLEL